MKPIDFWFFIGSTYTYLTVLRLREIGQDPDRVVALARSEETGTALESSTTEARKLGIFASPTFAVDGELFWGDDRLVAAVSRYREGRLTPGNA